MRSDSTSPLSLGLSAAFASWSSRTWAGVWLAAVNPRGAPVSGGDLNCLGDGLQLTDRFAAQQQRDEGADPDHRQQRA